MTDTPTEPCSTGPGSTVALPTVTLPTVTLATVIVPIGARVLVASDLHLGALADATSEACSTELARRLDRWEGPGVVVFAGDTFELWAEENNSPAKALRSHPRFADAVRRFGAPADRSVVVLAGNHDGALGWDERLAGEVRTELGAQVALALDLEIATGTGTERVRVEHGHQLDPHNAFLDPTRPGDRPLGHHVVTRILPGLRRGDDDAWLEGLDGLEEPTSFPRFVSSRLLYRRVARHLWWLALPIVAVAALRVLGWLLGLAGETTSPGGAVLSRLSTSAPFLVAGIFADLLLVALGILVASRRMVAALSSMAVRNGVEGAPPDDLNAAHRRRAVQLAAEGYRGLVTGHTHRAELIDLGGGFYANCGCNADRLEELPARLGLPTVFRGVRQSSWLEFEAGAELHAHIWLGESPTGRLPSVERWAARRRPRVPVRPTLAASLTPHGAWPAKASTDDGRRTRRIAAGAITLLGVINLVSALTPPIGARFGDLADLLPVAVPATAAFASAILAVALLLLAGGVRRGQRRAWAITIGVLVVSVLSNVVKGLDIEEAAVSLLVLGYLATKGSAFRGAADRGSSRRAVGILAAVSAAAAATALIVSVVDHLPLGEVAGGFATRLLGLGSTPLPGRLQVLSAAITAVGLVAVAGAGWLLLRPRKQTPLDVDRDVRAWDLVRRHGRGTLDYFALRDDKARYIWHDTVVAYAVRGGVAVVSPDPIGPRDEQAAAWLAFRRHAADNGWSIAVLGAGEEWLPTYRAGGMTAIYAGDEAVVDVGSFTLDGGRNKALRQAVNRVRRAGYHVEMCDPAHLAPEVARQLAEMMGNSRRGDAERGFSMTLSRLCDPRDTDLLIAIAYAPSGEVAAFCQYVPASGIDGYSLDVMRRAAGEHPNGLSDFVIVSTIEHLKAQGRHGLGLNFAAMRAVLAGEVADSWLNRRQRGLLLRLGQDMQIESLWRFNAKYDPSWTPRYVVIDGADRMLTAGFAVASAESLWELPLIGRFLRPEGALPAPETEPAPPVPTA